MRQATYALNLLVCLAVVPPVLGDVVRLTDGRTLEGRVRRAGENGWTVSTSDRRTTLVGADEVASIELNGRPAMEPVPNGAAGTVRWPAAKVTDPAAAAVADGRARQLVKGGPTAAAEAAVSAALAADPKDPSALYLLGLLRYAQSRLPAARQAFEGVAAAVPNHAPTLNNLGVILWQQRQYVAALARYDQAMLSSPLDAAVLDDVEAALAVVPDLPLFVGGSPVLDRVNGHYQEQAKGLSDRLTAAGLHKVGSAWVSADTAGRIVLQQRQARLQLDGLSAQFQQVQDRVTQIDGQVADVQSRMHRSAVDRLSPLPVFGDLDGGVGLPAVYYQLQNDDQQLQRRRTAEVARLDDLRRQAAAVRQQLVEAVPVQRLIGPEGTPLQRPVLPPTTRPAQSG